MKVGVVVVAYNPEHQVPTNLRALDGHHSLVVVDNSPIANEDVRVATEEMGGKYILAGRNLGISGALNLGFDQLRQEDPDVDAFLCFDQDSQVQSGFISTMVTQYEALIGENPRVAWLGPRYVDSSSAQPLDRVGDTATVLERATLFTSGLFLPAKTLDAVGPFDPSYFVDHADSEICLRARAMGLQNFQVPAARLKHRLGATTFHRVGRRTVRTTNHPPERLRSMTANRLRLWKTYWSTDRRWILGTDVPGFFQDVVKLVLFERNRIAKLSAIASGFTRSIRTRDVARPPVSV